MQIEPELRTSDRCDRCGAQAYVRATLANDRKWLFCLHHWRIHETRVRELAVHIQDETDALLA